MHHYSESTMKSPKSKIFVANYGPELTPAVRTALVLLLQAHDTAASFGQDKWDFALEIQALKEAGLNHNDLRFLICQGIAEHLVERTQSGSKHRAFRLPRGLRLACRSCFTLAAEALPVARQNVTYDGRGQLNACHLSKDLCHAGLSPFWDSDRRELRLGDSVVKRFRQPAKNQETILAAFQEDGWPPRIDNPLAGHGGAGAQDRLHDAVRKLNHQASRVLRFLCDGNGEGVIWQLLKATAPGAA
jgi:hypothetical protein